MPVPGDLLAATAELVAIPSVSHDEAAIATLVEKALTPCSALTVERVGDNVVARTELGEPNAWSWPATSTPCRPTPTPGRASTATPSGASAPRI